MYIYIHLYIYMRACVYLIKTESKVFTNKVYFLLNTASIHLSIYIVYIDTAYIYIYIYIYIQGSALRISKKLIMMFIILFATEKYYHVVQASAYKACDYFRDVLYNTHLKS